MTLEQRTEMHRDNIKMIERANIPFEVYDNSIDGKTGIAFPIEGSNYLLLMHTSTRDIETTTCYGYQFLTREELTRDGWK